jgi:hypothetical protein
MTILVAKHNVQVLPGRLTWLEAIHKRNMAGTAMLSSAFFSKMLLAEGRAGQPVPPEIDSAKPFYTGTFGAMNAKGQKLGHRVEAQCWYGNSRKTVIFEVPPEHSGSFDTAIFSDQIVAPDRTSTIRLFDAMRSQLIRTEDEMRGADEVILRFNGPFSVRQILHRNSTVYENVDVDKSTRKPVYLSVSEEPVLGLLSRGDKTMIAPHGSTRMLEVDTGVFDRQLACLYDRRNEHFSVAIGYPEPSAEASAEAKARV